MHNNEVEAEAFAAPAPEEEDVVLLTTRFGVHHPKNGHSFAAQMLLLPAPCAMCKATAFPLAKTAVCVRCRATVHRSCVSGTAQLCPWKFRSNNLERSDVEQWRTLVMRCIDREEWKSALSHVDISGLPMTLYEAVCQLCILPAYEQAVSPGQSSRKTIPFHEFLCKVASTLRIRSRVGTARAAQEVIRTVRLCCDAMAEIILELLPTRHTMLRSKELLMPVYEVADAMILGHKNAQIYKIVMGAFEQLTGALPPPPSDTDTPGHRRLPTLRSTDVLDKMLSAIAMLKEIPTEVTAVQKVQVLVRALSALASADTLADELLQRFSVTLRAPDMTMINWKAELRFMEEFVGRKDEWLLGEGGYALTTLHLAIEAPS